MILWCKSFAQKHLESPLNFGQTRSEIKRSAIIFPPFLPSSYVGLSENRAPPLVNHQISLSKIAILKDNNPI